MPDWLPVALRFALYADLALLFGVTGFSLYARRGRTASSGTPATMTGERTLLALAFVGLALTLASLFQMTASMSGIAIGQVDAETLWFILGETSLGASFIVRAAALVIASLVLLARPISAVRGWIAAAAAGVALGSLAWTGHGAMHEGSLRVVHLGADVVHLWAAGAWIGALMVLFLLVFRARRGGIEALYDAHDALAGFSWAGTIIVGLIVASGLVNAVLIVGLERLLALPESLYGQLLLAKLALFIAMLGLASANRFRLTPGLARAIEAGNHGRAVSALRLSVGIETMAAALILGLVAWLGTLEPAATTVAQ